MTTTDANPPMPNFPGGDYVLQEITLDQLNASVKPKQFLHIDQSECIMCEGCVDICPWKCIHMLGVDSIAGGANTVAPGVDPDDHVVFVVDEDVCTRCALCVDRCPTGVISLGKTVEPTSQGDLHQRDNNHGYAYGMRF
jgi:ferredoxin